MALGWCSARHQAVLFGMAASVLVASGTTSAGLECTAAGGVTEVDVSSDSDVQGLLELLRSCAGGVFDVNWHGRVAVNETFFVSSGTVLTVTGVHNFSSSLTQVGSGDDDVADDSTAGGAAVIDGGYRTDTGLFTVNSGSTLSLDNLVLEKGSYIYYSGGGAVTAGDVDVIDTATDTSYAWGPGSTVNVTDCTFLNNTATDGGERLRKKER